MKVNKNINIIAIVFVLFGCGGMVGESPDGKFATDGGDSATPFNRDPASGGSNIVNPSVPDTNIANAITIPAVAGEGLKDYNQLNGTMSSLTNISVANEKVKRTFDLVKSGLLESHSISGLTADHLASATKLAASYCSEMLVGEADNETFLKKVFPSQYVVAGNFTLDDLPSSENQDEVIESLVEQFLPQIISTFPRMSDLKPVMKDLYSDLLNQNINGVDATVGVCASLLSSLPILSF